ncbi:MAG: DUF1571 domain-containing protein [Rubripirellula sp.]|nr:DUF1571 domain-containing protein [Rubripirellula sp.]
MSFGMSAARCIFISTPSLALLGMAAHDSKVAAEEISATDDQAATHPLTDVLAYAKSRSDYLKANIQDYTGRLIKRERINGKLQSYQFIDVKMRCEQTLDNEVVPMAVFMRFLAPRNLKDRRILYVDGQNNNRMLVRKGGVSLQNVRLKIDPNGANARRESKYPVTDIGFNMMIDQLCSRAKQDMANDPTGENTRVTHFRAAKVGDRVCTRIQVVHPERGEGIEFHEANLYVDDELQLPIRLTVHGWPEKPADDKPLIEEYTYTKLRVNVGLSDAEFSETQLDSPAERATKTASNN